MDRLLMGRPYFGLTTTPVRHPQPRPGLRRYPVAEQQAPARQTVDELYQFADYYSQVGAGHYKPGLADALRNAAVLLDEYRAGSALEHPHPNSGWVLVPATLPAKAQAALEALITQLSAAEHLTPYSDAGLAHFYAKDHAAIEGGRAVLAVLEAVGGPK